MPAAFAQGPQCYSLPSLKGSNAVVGDYGAHVAITLAKRSFDGQGNLSGSFIVNEPKDWIRDRRKDHRNWNQKGTYTVNCDGTGVFTRFVTLSDGTTATQYDDFVITEAFSGWTSLVATKIVDAQRT
jgi:hypothetical protein